MSHTAPTVILCCSSTKNQTSKREAKQSKGKRWNSHTGNVIGKRGIEHTSRFGHRSSTHKYETINNMFADCLHCMCWWVYAENACKQRPQMRSIAHSMQPFISGRFVHISANSHFRSYFLFVFAAVRCGFIRFHLFCYWAGEIITLDRSHWNGWLVAMQWQLKNVHIRRKAAAAATPTDYSVKNERCISTTSVNRVTYLLFDEFVLHVVCMSIHFVIKGCESRHAFCPSIPMSQYRTEKHRNNCNC